MHHTGAKSNLLHHIVIEEIKLSEMWKVLQILRKVFRKSQLAKVVVPLDQKLAFVGDEGQVKRSSIDFVDLVENKVVFNLSRLLLVQLDR